MHLLAGEYSTEVKAGVNRLVNFIGTAAHICPPLPPQLRLLTPWRIPLEQFTTPSPSSSPADSVKYSGGLPHSVPPQTHTHGQTNDLNRRLAKRYVNNMCLP
jgi:hypothetical protein